MTRSLLSSLFALVVMAGAAPVHQFQLADEDAAVWDRKANTTTASLAAADSQPSGGIRVTIDPAEFTYGWVNRAFPDADYSGAGGLHGFYRSQGSGTVVGHVMLLGDQEASYFRSDLGQLADSRGEWVEFYLAFRNMRYERGPQKSFLPAQLGPRAKLQFLATVAGTQPVAFDVAGLEVLSTADAAPLARRLAREKLRRELLPEEQIPAAAHPRLLLSDAEVAALKADIDRHPELAQARDRIVALAEEELRTKALDGRWARVLSFREDDHTENAHNKRGAFEGRLTPTVTPLETLGAAYRLTGDERFARRAIEHALRMARELTVDNPLINEGFYYTRTFYVRALAFTYDWTGNLMTPAERQEIKTTLLGFVLDIHEQSQTGGWGRRPLHRVWNWDPGLMGAAGLGMLALEGETRTAEKAILFDCRRHLRDYLTLGIDQDGCGHEGPSYIGYGIGGGVEFSEILRRQGRDDLFVASNYDLCPPWLVAETLPGGGRFNNLSDCGHGQAPWPVYTYACGRLAELAATDPARAGERAEYPTVNRPLDMLAQFSEVPGTRQLSYASLAGLMSWVWENGPGRNSPSQFDGPRCLGYLLFFRPSPALADPAAVLPLAQHFSGRGLVVSRTGFGPGDWHLAVEAGPHAAGHDQCDKGTFTLRAYGADLAIDSGYGNDGDPHKSGSSYAHNVVLIDGEGQPIRYHNQSSGSVTGFHHSNLLDWVRVDARDAWGIRYDHEWRPTPTSPVERAERTFLLVRENDGVPPYLVVMDDIVKDAAERDYTWQWHIPANLAFATDSLPWRAEPQRLDFPVLRAPETNASAEFAFTVAAAGTYQLAALTRAGGKDIGKSDSLFVTLGDGPKITWDMPGSASLNWSLVRHRNAAGPATFTLEPGTHLVRLEKREPEAELAKLALLPAGAECPVSPFLDPTAGQVLTADDAKPGETPFPVVPAGTVQGSETTLEVFPVRPAGGKVATDWFETSREGSHPRLHYTVRSSAPRFLMVLLPRQEGTPRPEVVPDGDWGARILWGGTEDTVRFSREPGREYGSATFRRQRQGRTLAEAWLDAPRDGQPTVATQQR
ncbi:MAG: heparinase II/III family protein [Lentisphaeria bacterium]|jgi:hypothetical protein|nr:heparinase II/III family protein [Lentisphaeria bacterium]